MWRPILIGLVLCALYTAAAAAQIERNLDSRSRAEGGARRRPSAGQTHVRQPAAGPVRLNVAQRALTVEIVVACRKAGQRAVEYEALRQRSAARAAGARLVRTSPEPAADAQLVPEILADPAAADDDAAAVAEAPAPEPAEEAATAASEPETNAVAEPATSPSLAGPAENAPAEADSADAAPVEPEEPATSQVPTGNESASAPLIPADAKTTPPIPEDDAETVRAPRTDLSSGEGRRPETNSLAALAEARRAPVQIEDVPAPDNGTAAATPEDTAAATPPAEQASAEAPAESADAPPPAAADSASSGEDAASERLENTSSTADAESADAESKETRRPDLSRWSRRAHEEQAPEAEPASVDKLLGEAAEPAETGVPEVEAGAAEDAAAEPAADSAAPEPEPAAAEPAAADESFYERREPEPWQRATPPEPPLTAPDDPAPAAAEDTAGTTLEQLSDIGRSVAPPAAPAAAVLPAARAPRGLLLSVGGHPGASGGGFPAAPVDLVLPAMSPRQPAIQLPANLAAISRGNPKKKLVALTFDDGPHPYYTSQLLAVLAYYRTPATFFFVGIQAQKYPQWVKMTHQAGHEIGSHTYDHFRLPKLPPAEQAYQIDEYQRLIEGLTGSSPRFLRPPGGNVDDNLKRLTAQRGMVVALWDVALNDTAQDKTSDQLLKSTLKSVRPGSIILAHDGVQATINMLPQLITRLRREGYSFVTLSELAAGL